MLRNMTTFRKTFITYRTRKRLMEKFQLYRVQLKLFRAKLEKQVILGQIGDLRPGQNNNYMYLNFWIEIWIMKIETRIPVYIFFRTKINV